MKRKWLVASCTALVLSLVVVNAQFSRDFSEDFTRSAAGRAFIQVYGALQSNYLEDVDSEKIIQGAIRGMLEALEDPFTSYETPESAARASEDRSGSFSGIGASLSPRDRINDTIVEVINVYSGSPAEQAGVRRGDIFALVDGVDVSGFTTREIVDVVRGPRGSTVTIGMRRSGAEDIVFFDIVRDTIEIVSVQSTMLDNNVGYVEIMTFANQRVHEQLVRQLEQLRAQGATSLILDMRNNGGGLLTQGIMVADEFLDQGDIVFQRARGITQRLASASPSAFDLPMVVLVNRNSASASEIVAGALQDNGRALVIGEETFGKGVGQSVISLTNGGQLVYLSFEWLTPNRNSINQQGIVPDIKAEDGRFGNVVRLEGQGARAGEEVEIIVAGERVGTTLADEDGSFSFFQLRERPEMSADQGVAVVDLENDSALRIAFDTLLDVVAGRDIQTRTQTP